LPGGLIFFVGVGSCEVEVQLVGVDFGEELAAAAELFQVEKFIFFEAVHGFHVALIGVGGGRDEHMLAIAEGRREIAFELATIVGLPDQIAQRDAVAIQMLLNACGEDRTGGGTALLSEGPEQQAAAHFARGVLDGRQAELLSLRPVAWDIVEILRIRADLLEQRPLRFDVREVLLALIFFLSFFQQAVRAPDAFQGAMADGQIELADKAAGTEREQGSAQFDDALL